MRDNDWIRTNEAAVILGLDRHAVEYRIKSGDLVPAWPPDGQRIKGKPVYLSRSACEAIGRRWHKPQYDSWRPAIRQETTTPPESEFVTHDQAAEILGVTRDGLRLRVDRGELIPVPWYEVPPAERAHNMRHYFRRSDLQAPADWVTIAQAAEILALPIEAVEWRAQAGYLTARPAEKGRNERSHLLYLRLDEVEWMRDEQFAPARERPEHVLMPPIAHCAYMAGILDGEGCIYIYHSKATRSQYYLQAVVYNTHKGVIDWLHATFGGSVAERQPKAGERKLQYIWKTASGAAYAVLKLAVPHLRIKREQALLGIEFHEHVCQTVAGRGRRLPPEEAEWRERQKQRISALNGKKPLA